jgi:hypothetical protein
MLHVFSSGSSSTPNSGVVLSTLINMLVSFDKSFQLSEELFNWIKLYSFIIVILLFTVAGIDDP